MTVSNDAGQCDAVVTWTAPTGADNCAGAVVTSSHNPGDTFPIGTTTVTYTITDAAGLTASCSFNVTVNDTQAPIFNSCPPGISVNNDIGVCGAIANYTIPTASDNCGTATVTQTDGTGLTSGDLFPIGTTTIEYTADDGNGNTTICSFTISVTDIEAPSITCPGGPITINADANCEATTVALGTPVTNDNCTVTSVTNDLAGQLPLPVGTHTVTWTVTDTAGLTATCTQQVTVQDITPPVITCPTPNAFYNTDAGQCDATLTFNATATDNCNGSPIITYEVAGTPITFPYAFPTGTTTVDVIADDGNGLITTCSFNVIVQDNEAPTAVCQTFTVPLDASGNASIVASDIDGGSFDNCSTVTLNASQTTFSCANVGTNNVTLTVTDAAGNIATCNAVVTVLDHVQGATATITSTPSSPICLGESVTFTATGTNLGANPSYQWYEGGTPVGTNSDTYITTGLTNGENVYVEITSGPCNTVTISNSIVMTVNPLLPVTFTLNASANPACSGDNITFFVTGLTNGGATPTYQWYVNGTPVGGNTNAYSSTTINDNDVVSVDVSSSLACANPIPATQSIPMTVTPNATISLISANDVQTVCNGTAMTDIVYNITNASNAIITGIPTGVTGTYNSGTFTISGTPTQIGIFNYTITAIGCGNITANGTISVGPDATINLISPSENDGICNDGLDNLNLQFQLNSGATGATLTSTPALPAGITGNFDSNTGIYSVTGTTTQNGIYNYTVTTTGCGAGDSITGVIRVYDGIPSTPSSINGPSSFFCPVTEAIYSVPIDPNVETYNWTVSGGFTIQSGQGTNEVTLAVNGWAFLETITVTATNACGTSSSISETVLFNFTISDIDAGPDIYVCAGTTQVTMAGDAGGLDYDEWTWDDNGAGGTFSTELVSSDCVWVCTDYWWIFCIDGYYDCTDVYDYTETSTYTIPPTAQPGDVITISLIADNWFWCDPLVSTMQIHILEDPEAEIVSTDQTICEGDSTTITFSGTPGAQIRFNDGSGNTQVTLNSSGNYTLNVSPATTTTYTLNRVRYTNGAYPGGNNNCNVTLNESVTINVNTTPTVTAPADVTICEGDTVNLSAATIGGTNYVGTWTTSGNGTFAGNIYTPHAADVFNSPITLTYTNTPSDGICSPVSDSMLVTINQAPTIYAGVDQTICNNDTVTMTASFGGSATSGTWSGGTGTFSSNLPNATYTPGIGETGTVILTYTSNDPAGPCNSAIDTVEITIDQGATVDAGTDQTICEGDTVSLTASFGGSATSATWNTSGSGTFAGNIYTPSVSDINNGSVLLTYTTNNPTGVCNSVSDSMLVTINPQPTVDVGNNQTVCSTSTGITMNAVLGGGASSAIWSTSGDGVFNNNNTNAVYSFGANDMANGTVTLTYTTNDPAGPCIAAADSFVVNIIPYIAANPSYTYATNNGDCSDTVLNLSADGTGYWSAVSVPAGSPYSFSDNTNPNAIFTGESGTEYNLTWNVDNAAPCADDTATINVVFPNCGVQIDFDGTDDSVNFANSYNLSGNFSIEAWIKPNAINGSIQTILSKRNANNFATGYDLRLVNNTISFHANGSNISANGITSNRWYHIAVTYNGTNYTLYVDGVQRNSTAGPNPATNNFNMLLGAMSRVNNTPTNYYNGWIDEVRIWNTNLSTTQIRQMMNQEIQNNGGLVRGSIVPIDITGIAWNNLIAYYQMNQGTADITAGQLNANVGVSGTLRNMTSLQAETAPLPYISNNNGSWDTNNTWLNGSVQMIPNTNGVDWNIVRIQHNINSGNRATTLLGLLVDNNRYTIDNNQLLRVNGYLRIDGVLDLEGESQLMQNNSAVIDYTSSTGYMERDQQGTANTFNYNYWGSPVSSTGVASNRAFRLDDILYNGNTKVQWTTGNNGSTTPLTISSRWVYTFSEGLEADYSEWAHEGNLGTIDAGLGYTMKGPGPGAATGTQNYTFRGMPNNGTISASVTAQPTFNNQTLVGNPYPSAINALEFIRDNIPGGNSGTTASIDGSLYFWKQASTNASHLTAEYQGGYATYNLSGGLAAVSPPGINGPGDATLAIPRQFIPVGQGFFVTSANHTNQVSNTVSFRNSQRAFVKEASGNSIFLRTNNDEETVDLIKRIRLNFTSPEGAIRPLLLAFTPNNEATDGFDYGYDAKNSDVFPSDMSFVIDNENYVIQGVGEFNVDNMYPVNISLGTSGTIEIELTDLENFDEDIDVYVYDALLGNYSRINTVNYQIALDAGNHANRYFIAFKEDATLNTVDEEFSNVMVNYLNATNEVYINVPTSVDIKQVYLVNMLGQTVKSWNATNAPLAHECRLPVKNVSEGNYIIKVRTSDNKLINKKVIIMQN
ncbi:HYR domain-containing protein [uncultured Xanthomarina sp.]|uniref:HYR domain-containing protein n=1 Tax=uncultured Xanthomarina sp. TaxID=1868331 RepID=UPI0030D723DA